MAPVEFNQKLEKSISSAKSKLGDAQERKNFSDTLRFCVATYVEELTSLGELKEPIGTLENFIATTRFDVMGPASKKEVLSLPEDVKNLAQDYRQSVAKAEEGLSWLRQNGSNGSKADLEAKLTAIQGKVASFQGRVENIARIIDQI